MVRSSTARNGVPQAGVDVAAVGLGQSHFHGVHAPSSDAMSSRDAALLT